MGQTIVFYHLYFGRMTIMKKHRTTIGITKASVFRLKKREDQELVVILPMLLFSLETEAKFRSCNS